MHRTLALVTLLLGVGLLAAAPPLEDLIKKDEETLAGTWRVQSAEVGGQNVPIKEFRDLRMTYKHGKFTARKGKETPEEGTYKLDPGKKPKAIDITRATGREKGKTQLAIYSLTGNTFKICSCISGKERPKSFDTRDKPDYVLMVLKREP